MVEQHPVIVITKKEIMDNIRNKWIMLITLIFAALTVLVSYFGSLGQGWQSLELTIAGMMALVQYLIPIIGLMLGYAAIAGEIERGSMSALLALPVQRYEIILGKFLGLGSVLSFAILLGFGIAGVIIGINVSEVNYGEYLIFIGASILLGLVFVSLALFSSAFFKRRSTSMGMVIFLWFFFTMIWGIILIGIVFATMDFAKALSEGFPTWFYVVDMINPLSAYSTLVSLNVGPVSSVQHAQTVSMSYPEFYTSGLMSLILIIWISVPLFFAFWRFKKREI